MAIASMATVSVAIVSVAIVSIAIVSTARCAAAGGVRTHSHAQTHMHMHAHTRACMREHAPCLACAVSALRTAGLLRASQGPPLRRSSRHTTMVSFLKLRCSLSCCEATTSKASVITT